MSGWHFMWMVLWWSFILVGIIWIIWMIGNPARIAGHGRETPETILKTRYARGEIDSEEYQQKLKELRE